MDRRAVGCSLAKVASAERVRSSFLDELVSIDPLMKKVAFSPFAPTGMSAIGTSAVKGAKWLKDNPWKAAEGALTVASLYPGVRAARGLGGAAKWAWNWAKAKKLRSGGKYTKHVANAYKRHAGTSLKTPLDISGFGYGKHVPGQFRNLSKWGKLKRMGSALIGLEGSKSAGESLGRDMTKAYKDRKLRQNPPKPSQQWNKSPQNAVTPGQPTQLLKKRSAPPSPPPVNTGPWKKAPQNARPRPIYNQ